jgi:xanthine dehydrogenase YagS FAD-binding subunit
VFGGENCYYVHPSDMAPALAALGAKVHVAGPKGIRTVSLEKFFVMPEDDYTRETVLEPGEIVMDIELPPPDEGLRSSYRKVRARRAWDFALAGVAMAVVFTGKEVAKARVYLSGVAPIPWRANEVEALITTQRLDQDLIRKASEAVVRNAQPMEQNAYKVPLIRAIVEEQLQIISKA